MDLVSLQTNYIKLQDGSMVGIGKEFSERDGVNITKTWKYDYINCKKTIRIYKILQKKVRMFSVKKGLQQKLLP